MYILIFLLNLLIKMQGENIDMDEALGKIQHNHPLILGFGSDLSHMVEFRVVIEKNNVITMPSLLDLEGSQKVTDAD